MQEILPLPHYKSYSFETTRLSNMPEVTQLVTESATQTPEHNALFVHVPLFVIQLFILQVDISFHKGGSC